MNATGQARQALQGGLGSGATPPGLAGEAAASGIGPRSAERAVADAADRLLRAPQDKVALVLHLSQMPPPVLKAHHLRVARMLMQDCARRFDGQVFALQNHDLVLLSGLPRTRPAGGAAPAAAETPADLRQCLVGLFAEATVEPQKLVSYWRLGEDAAPLRSFIGGVLAGAAGGSRESPLAPDDMAASAASLAALEEVAANAPLAELVQQQTGMVLDPDRKLPLALRLKPAFRHLNLSLSALNLPLASAESLTDPFLLHHFSARLQLRLMQVLQDDLRVAGRLTRVALKTGLPIMLELAPEATLGPGFTRLTRLAQDTGARFIIEMPLMQACLDIALLDQVRGRLAAAGFGLCIGPLDNAALRLALPAKLRPDMARVLWSPLLAAAASDPKGRVALTLAQLGPARLVLAGVESEQAVAWGQALGISRFQGPFLDQVQAATRMAGCPGASACTLRQCSSRAASQGDAGRAGCTNPALLDAGTISTPLGSTPLGKTTRHDSAARP